MPPVDGQTFVNAPGFSVVSVPFQHLNEGKLVIAGADFAGEQTDEPPKHVSKLGVINEDEITSFAAVKLWIAA